MAIEVTPTLNQLRNAYKEHFNCSQAEKEKISHHLLLCYAVECGLKAQYLHEQFCLPTDTTAEFTRLLGKPHGHGHDILRWSKDIKLPNLAETEFQQDSARPLIELHQRLRYGMFSQNLEKQQIMFLKTIAKLLKQAL
jgi:hypothetical protein